MAARTNRGWRCSCRPPAATRGRRLPTPEMSAGHRRERRQAAHDDRPAARPSRRRPPPVVASAPRRPSTAWRRRGGRDAQAMVPGLVTAAARRHPSGRPPPRRPAASAVTPALRAKVMQRRPAASHRQTPACASSARNTATPSAARGRWPRRSRATASTLAMNSWCSRCALVITTTVGWAMPASTRSRRVVHAQLEHRRTVRARPAASRSTAGRCGCSGCRWVASAASPSARHGDAGDHLRDGGLAIVAHQWRSPAACSRRPPGDTLVWPPAGTTMRDARGPLLQRLEGIGHPARRGPPVEAALGQRRHRARPGPAGKSCVSKRSPRSATNRSPGRSVRVSLCTRLKTARASPCSTAPGSSAGSGPASCACGRPAADRARPPPGRRRRRLTPPISLVVRCPLPATRITSAEPASSTARGDGEAAIDLHHRHRRRT